MLLNKKRVFKKSERGMALVESIPVLFTIVILFNFSLGFFGAIHSGILNSIASYNYTLETFRFRSNLIYLRPGAEAAVHYKKAMNRVHGTIQDGNDTDEGRGLWPATVRSLAFSANPALTNANGDSSRKYTDKDSGGIWGINKDFLPSSGNSPNVSEIWIKTVYGICLNAECKKVD